MNNAVLGAEELKALSPQEREYALKILEELQTTGNSKLFEDLVYADYKEIPTDIVTFIKDTQYLGKAWHLPDGKCKLFPFWENKLKELFPDNIHTNFNTFIESGARGLGKAQPLSSLVLTPNGYVPMSQIKVGSDVVGVDGNSYGVSGVFPQGDRDIYQFTFEDGTVCECADNHLWEVYDKLTTKTAVMTTLELLESGITYPNGKKSRYSIPVCSPIKMSSIDLWLDPYVLGVIFECGCLYDDKVIIALSNEQIAKNISKILSAEKYKLKKCPQGYEIYTKDKYNKYYDFVISNDINLSAVFKRIPQYLKVNDIYTRQSILSGILDVDGKVNRLTKFIELSTLNKQYAEDVAWIVRSLGGICTIEERNIKSLQFKSRDAVNIETYELYIKLPKGINAFRFVDVELDPSFVPPAHKDIDKIEYIGHEECQCIIVNYDRHLYITDGFNVTHNSEIAVTVGLYLMHRLMCLKNPYQTLNLKPTEQVAFAFMNITKGLAENIGVTKFQNTVQSSPWFMSRGTITGRTNLMWNPPEFINLIVGSQSSDVIGQAIYYCLDGNTVILTDRGEKKLSEIDGDVRVASLDSNGNIVYSEKCSVLPTKTSDVEYQIELEDGTMIKCTPEHRLMLKDGSYKEAQYLTEEDELMDIIPYGYIYETINAVNGKKYIGKHKSGIFDSTYVGSGVALKEAVRKYGKENFNTTILSPVDGVPTVCYSLEELNSSERFYINYFNCVSSDDFYNMSYGGDGGDIIPCLTSDRITERNRKISEANVRRWQSLSDDAVRERSVKWKNTWNSVDRSENNLKLQLGREKYFTELSDEEKGKYLKKLSDAHRRRSVAQEVIRKNKERATKNNWSDSKRSQYLLNQLLSHKGRKVFTDGKTVIRCFPQDAPKGFYLGGLNKNKFKYIYEYDGRLFNGKTELVMYLKLQFPLILKSNIDSIVQCTPQAKRKFPLLIGKIIRRDRNENKIN